jgi:hypothetical protein
MALTQRLERGEFIVWDGESQAVLIHPYGKGIVLTQELDMVELSHKQMEEIIKLYKLLKKEKNGF